MLAYSLRGRPVRGALAWLPGVGVRSPCRPCCTLASTATASPCACAMRSAWRFVLRASRANCAARPMCSRRGRLDACLRLLCYTAAWCTPSHAASHAARTSQPSPKRSAAQSVAAPRALSRRLQFFHIACASLPVSDGDKMQDLKPAPAPSQPRQQDRCASCAKRTRCRAADADSAFIKSVETKLFIGNLSWETTDGACARTLARRWLAVRSQTAALCRSP